MNYNEGGPMSSLGELAAEYAALIDSKKKSEIAVKDFTEQLSGLEERLLEAMTDAGLQNLKLESGLTLYHAIDRFYGPAEGVTKEDLILELGRHPETMDLVAPSYNANSLRARMKEIEANGEVLPEELSSKIKITERDRVRHRS
jgi:hypothetical protein